MDLNKYLEEIGLKYEDLNQDEKSTFKTWEDTFKKERTVANILAFISWQIHELGDKLLQAIEDGDKDKIVFYGGRIRNYREMQAFIEGPDKAKDAIRKQLSSLIK